MQELNCWLEKEWKTMIFMLIFTYHQMIVAATESLWLIFWIEICEIVHCVLDLLGHPDDDIVDGDDDWKDNHDCGLMLPVIH